MKSSQADVVVIGSGFGGSISTNRLALAGLKVLVLERGPWRDSLPVRSMGIARRAPFPYGMRSATHMVRTVHFRGRDLTLNKSGLFEVFLYPGIRVFVVSAVGGGSHGPVFEKIRDVIRAPGAESGLKTWTIRRMITVHPWGGACLGAGPDRGVVDHNAEVYGNPGLFIADGSVLPAAVGTPPSLTIAAWAHHVADSLIQRATEASR